MSDPSAWCLPNGQSGSLEVDFGENVLVCAVETRGFDDGGDGLYAQEFELSFAANGDGFAEYTEDGATRVRANVQYLFSLTLPEHWTGNDAKGVDRQTRNVVVDNQNELTTIRTRQNFFAHLMQNYR